MFTTLSALLASLFIVAYAPWNWVNVTEFLIRGTPRGEGLPRLNVTLCPRAIPFAVAVPLPVTVDLTPSKAMTKN